jgi:hypothetical protein
MLELIALDQDLADAVLGQDNRGLTPPDPR